MTASPANFSTVPPWVTMQCDTWSKKRLTRRRTTSGSTSARSSVEATRSTKRTVASLRSMLSMVVGWYWCGLRLARPGTARFHTIGAVLDPKVFKAYDVRGVYPDELDEDGAYTIGRAYVQQFEPRRIAVGRDMRLSSPQMAAAVIRGAADEGAEVLDVGLVGTEMVYFAVGELELDGGIMVTASHNPKEYTGMKIVRRGALPLGLDSGLDKVRDRRGGLTPGRGRKGQVEEVDIWPGYVERVLSFVDVAAIR